MTVSQLDVNIILTSQKKEDVEIFIDLELIKIRDGTADVEKIAGQIKEAVIAVLTKYGDVDEF
jgi:hypothetical protein